MKFDGRSLYKVVKCFLFILSKQFKKETLNRFEIGL